MRISQTNVVHAQENIVRTSEKVVWISGVQRDLKHTRKQTIHAWQHTRRVENAPCFNLHSLFHVDFIRMKLSCVYKSLVIITCSLLGFVITCCLYLITCHYVGVITCYQISSLWLWTMYIENQRKKIVLSLKSPIKPWKMMKVNFCLHSITFYVVGKNF